MHPVRQRHPRDSSQTYIKTHTLNVSTSFPALHRYRKLSAGVRGIRPIKDYRCLLWEVLNQPCLRARSAKQLSSLPSLYWTQAERAHLFLFIHGHLCASPSGRCQEARPESRGQNNEGEPFYFTAENSLLPFPSLQYVCVCVRLVCPSSLPLGFPMAR